MDFKHESATATFRPLNSYSGLLLHVRSNFKRQGHATELMYLICRWADENCLLLYLEPRVFERGGIPDNKTLIEWYKRFGFVVDPNVKRNRQMLRYPSQEIHTL